MAKREINKYTREQRLKRIAECQKCMGSPPTKTCNLQGLVFQVCDLDDCMEIIGDYSHEGAPIKIKSTIAVPAGFQDPNFRKEIETEQIPGLGDLNII